MSKSCKRLIFASDPVSVTIKAVNIDAHDRHRALNISRAVT